MKIGGINIEIWMEQVVIFFPAPCGGAPYSMVVPQEKLESSIASIKQDFARL